MIKIYFNGLIIMIRRVKKQTIRRVSSAKEREREKEMPRSAFTEEKRNGKVKEMWMKNECIKMKLQNRTAHLLDTFRRTKFFSFKISFFM